MLEFSLGNAHPRTISIHKIDKLFKVISEFREAVYAEAALIDAVDSPVSGLLC